MFLELDNPIGLVFVCHIGGVEPLGDFQFNLYGIAFGESHTGIDVFHQIIILDDHGYFKAVIHEFPCLSSPEVVTMLQDNGFILKSRKGSHMKFEKDGKTVVVPAHGKKSVEKGTYHSILRQAGLK